MEGKTVSAGPHHHVGFVFCDCCSFLYFCTSIFRQVLHEYVDMMDFKGMRFDDAIRHYLSGFRLPGEAQKIDRMMEKFSERFCLQVCSLRRSC